MALSVVDELDDFESFHAARTTSEAPYRTSQDARGAAPHALSDHRAYSSQRPATAFPTKEVIAILGAIGAVLGARVALLLALGMMFALGFTASDEASGRWRMAIFGAFGVVPVVWLSARRSL